MNGKMKGVTLVADWDPKLGFELGAKDIEGRQTYLGSLVYRNPRIEIREYDIPSPGPEEGLVEVKACESIHPIHKAQLLSYMKLLDIPLGLIINFNELKLADGISRLILPGANRE